MRVRVCRGGKIPTFRIAVPYQPELSEMNPSVHKAATKLEGSVFEQMRALRSDDSFEKPLLAPIEVEGVAIWKIEGFFDEIGG